MAILVDALKWIGVSPLFSSSPISYQKTRLQLHLLLRLVSLETPSVR